MNGLLCVLSCLEASAAVNRSVAGGLEGDLRLTAALCAGGDKVLSLSSASVLLSVAASLAALRLVQKALFLVELLLASGEYELIAALFAYKRLVLKDFVGCANHGYFFVHCFFLSLWIDGFSPRRTSTDTFEIVQRSVLSYWGIFNSAYRPRQVLHAAFGEYDKRRFQRNGYLWKAVRQSPLPNVPP